ncbi:MULTISPECIES: iron-siderophore ABC transporter substrate-binding protein [Actinokineospora]|uniref:ABC transporter substrate-binding protein n=1 Tax=Actinokineospora fastidiosa TaxID=1816 RepID=A0A918GAR6_9PSEU|nr:MULTISPECIES: iron-siderophore ABC transporter substrate-binding protein [Actinokineospora]UVS79315.1 putative siderophore-binding lipoprotein YfiY precursor [Actinokineospora sp. UTMC 2448]GGS27581.1 ABC transporter substrate-binding protein [Actinokineospora fastidiosa]
MSIMSTGSRRLRLVAAVLTAGFALAACGGGGTAETPASTTAAAQTQAEGNSLPVTVEHKYGTTTVEKADRIVTLGLSDHEIVLALGVKPVGAVDWFGERPFGVFPWQAEKWAGTEPAIVGVRDDYDIEKIIELQPDLIIAQYSGMSQEQYDTLSELFDVVAQPKEHADYAAPWQAMTRAVGKAMGKADQAEALIKGIDEKFAKVRAEHPEFAGKTVVVADAFQPGTYSAFAAHDPKVVFMNEIGFQSPQRIKDVPKEKNVIDVSSEGLDLFESDRLIWLTSDPEAEKRIKADPLYGKLKVAAEGRDLFVPYSDPPVGAAISFNTVLSIPYAIDNMVPLLVAQS